MTPYLEDTDFTLYVGDVRDILAGLPAESVHCVVTSPPYWGLRDYGTVGQLGLELTPDEFVANMVAVFRGVRRVLRADGSLWLNLGDSYVHGSGGGGSVFDSGRTDGRKSYASDQVRGRGAFGTLVPGLKVKDMCGIPWRVAFALQEDGWYLRADIIWAKPNPMPESVTDRPTKAHEYLFLLTKSPRYYFDQEAVREPHNPKWLEAWERHPKNALTSNPDSPVRDHSNGRRGGGMSYPDGGRNVRSVWEIATQPYPDAHFATFPEELPRRCILAGTSEHGVCPECGAPWERVVENRGVRKTHGVNEVSERTQRRLGATSVMRTGVVPVLETMGWLPSCDCGEVILRNPVPATVLDPFTGSGTTNHVARKHGRRSIGIELNPVYAQLCAKRMSQLSLLA